MSDDANKLALALVFVPAPPPTLQELLQPR
jgi:hypothetical protein